MVSRPEFQGSGDSAEVVVVVSLASSRHWLESLKGGKIPREVDLPQKMES